MALDLPPQPRTFTLSMLEEGLELSVSVRLLELPSETLAPLYAASEVGTSDACCAAFARLVPRLVPQVIAMHQQSLQDAYQAVNRARIDLRRRAASETPGEVNPKHAPAPDPAP